MKTLAAIQLFIQSRQALKLSTATIEWYNAKLAHFALSYPKLPKTPDAIDKFLTTIPGEQNAHGYYRALKAFYRFLKKRYQVINPIDLVILKDPNNRKTDKPTLEVNQLFSILQAAKTLRDRAILTLLIDTGMRAGELASLKRQYILPQEVKVFGKTGWRNIPISEETRRLLLVLISQDGKDEYVFHGERGPLGRDGVYRVVSRYMSQVGIDKPKLGPHRIRHAFAKNFLMNGGDLYSLMKIMGHSSITTTEEYLRYTNRDTIMKHNQFTPLRSVLAAAQASMFTAPVIKEAEAILQRGSATRSAIPITQRG